MRSIQYLEQEQMNVISHNRSGQNISSLERAGSIAAGALLALRGIRRGGPTGYLAAFTGAELVRRGATGRCYLYDALGLSTSPKGQGSATTSVAYPLGIGVEERVHIAKEPAEVYNFWRRLENLPCFMHHLESVETSGTGRSHWVARGPVGSRVEWDAEIINDVPDRLIAWRTIGGDVQSAGSVQFKRSELGGTDLQVKLQYNPPAGLVGAGFAKLFGEEPSQQIREDLSRLKTRLESKVLQSSGV